MARRHLTVILASVLTVGLAPSPSPGESDDSPCVVSSKLTASDGSTLDMFGFRVSASNDILLVASPGDDDAGRSSGAAYLFELGVSGEWTELQKLTASDAAPRDLFGESVAISDDLAIVGVGGDDDNGPDSGSARIFEPDSSGFWTETAKLLAPDGAPGDRFGVSVALFEDVALVGAYFDDDAGSDSGSVHVFERDALGFWNATAKLVASDGQAIDLFGQSVAVSGDQAVIGAEGDDDRGRESGAAYVFERGLSGNWLEVAKLTPSDGVAGDAFGASVDISQGVIIVGARGSDSGALDSGAAYVFARASTGAWNEVSKLSASDAAAGDLFGRSVSIEGELALVGAWLDDDQGMNSGSAYVFRDDGSGSWDELTKLAAPDGAAGDNFGFSTSIAGDVALVGVWNDDDDGASSGSAHVFSCVSACGDECDLTLLLLPLLPGNPSLPSTHPCLGAPTPTAPSQATCEGLALLRLALPSAGPLPTTHPCVGIAAPPTPSTACCETVQLLAPECPGGSGLPSTHPCLTR